MGLKRFFKGLVGNIKKRGTKDILDPNVWKAYAEWHQIENNGIQLSAKDIRSYSEQVVWRMSVCKPCVDNGQCLSCDCYCPEAMMTPKAKCKDGKWPKLMEPDVWEQYKKDNNIELIAIGG